MGKKERYLIWGLLGLVTLVSLYFVVLLSVWFAYQGKAYPGVSVAGVSVAGLNEAEIKEQLRERTQAYLGSSITLAGAEISPKEIELQFELDQAAKEAITAAKNSFFLGQMADIEIPITYNEAKLYSLVRKNESKHYKKVENAQIVSVDEGEYVIEPGKSGSRLLYAATFRGFETTLGSLGHEVGLVTKKIEPSYSAGELREIAQDYGSQFADGFELNYGGKSYNLTEIDILGFVRLVGNGAVLAERFGGDPLLEPIVGTLEYKGNFSETQIANRLKELAIEIESKPVNAALGVKDGKVVVSRESQIGIELDVEASAAVVAEALISNGAEADLVVATTEPEISQKSLPSLGLTELVSTGYSNFAGSPANRRHNIRVGASKFNGLLVAPGDTFSFTTNLGEVDAANGYLPELVIKENTTTPEYGGGLCQVSTTAFRAALNAGVPITARKAHSYPVSYYKPYGTDATIYIPNPDLRFKNDTGSHLFIQTRIEGNNLYFDFYGTKKDIRVAFAGNKNATGAVSLIEKVTPYTYDFGGRGSGSFKAIFYRFIYDQSGKLTGSESFYSNYDSPDKYPH